MPEVHSTQMREKREREGERENEKGPSNWKFEGIHKTSIVY